MDEPKAILKIEKISWEGENRQILLHKRNKKSRQMFTRQLWEAKINRETFTKQDKLDLK